MRSSLIVKWGCTPRVQFPKPIKKFAENKDFAQVFKKEANKVHLNRKSYQLIPIQTILLKMADIKEGHLMVNITQIENFGCC